MAGDEDKAGESGGGGYLPPALMPLPAHPGYGYPGMVMAPSPNAAAPAEALKLSDAVPAQVRAELPWLVKTAKQNRMPVGVVATGHRLLLIVLDDLEKGFGVDRAWSGVWFGSARDLPAIKRLKRLQKVGAVTKAVVDEAKALKLTPAKKAQSLSSGLGDPQDAARYVAFVRMLVDVAYEARAKYRKNQLPTPKTHSSTSMTLTVGPASGAS